MGVFNVLYTSLPILVVGMFDQDVDAKHSLQFPKLYSPGLRSALFNKLEFLKSVFYGIICSVVLFFVSYGKAQIQIALSKNDSIA